MAEFSAGDLPNFSISHDLFSDITADERFPTLPKQELANLRGKNQNQNTSKSIKTLLNVFNEWKVQRNEARKLEDIYYPLSWARCNSLPFFRWNSKKKDGQDYEPESLAVMQCSLDRHLKNCGRNYSILRDREFANSRQQLEAKARELRAQGYGKVFFFSIILLLFCVIMAFYSAEYFGNKNNSQYFSLPFFKDNNLTEQCPITD